MGLRNDKKNDVLFVTKRLLKRMDAIAAEGKGGGAILANAISAGRIKNAKKLESKYGLSAGL